MNAIGRREFLERMAWGIAALTVGPARRGPRAGDGPPNIVLILADDLGYGDPGSAGRG